MGHVTNPPGRNYTACNNGNRTGRRGATLIIDSARATLQPTPELGLPAAGAFAFE